MSELTRIEFTELAEGVDKATLWVKYPENCSYSDIEHDVYGTDSQIHKTFENYLRGDTVYPLAKYVAYQVTTTAAENITSRIVSVDHVTGTGTQREPCITGWECVGNTAYYPILMQLMYGDNTAREYDVLVEALRRVFEVTDDAVWVLELQFLGNTYWCWIRSAVRFEGHHLGLHIQACSKNTLL